MRINTSTENDVVRAGWKEQLAWAITYVLNPLILPPLLFVLLLKEWGAPTDEVILIGSIALGCYTLAPLAVVAWMVQTRKVDSLEVRDRGSRTLPFLAGLLANVVALILMLTMSTSNPAFLSALAGTFILNTLLLFLINSRWKISLHAAGMAGFFSVALFFSVSTCFPSFGTMNTLLMGASIALPLVMWARVKLEAHTLAQVVGGAFFGLALPYLELYVIGQLNIAPLC